MDELVDMKTGVGVLIPRNVHAVFSMNQIGKMVRTNMIGRKYVVCCTTSFVSKPIPCEIYCEGRTVLGVVHVNVCFSSSTIFFD